MNLRQSGSYQRLEAGSRTMYLAFECRCCEMTSTHLGILKKYRLLVVLFGAAALVYRPNSVLNGDNRGKVL